jgi:hypothetical protein
MIGRLLWIAILAALGVIITVLQIDRQADISPALAATVPEPMRGYAQTRVALAAIEGEDPAAALAATKALVRRRPLPAEHLTLLASAQAKAGQAEAAAFTIQMAARRGWREPVAQEAVLRLALAAGDKPEAARRYGALLRRTATPDDLLTNLAPEVFGTTGDPARETLAKVIAGAPRWHSQYLQRGLQVLPPEVFGEITALALGRGARFTCNALAPVIETLRRRDPAAAARLEGPARERCV